MDMPISSTALINFCRKHAIEFSSFETVYQRVYLPLCRDIYERYRQRKDGPHFDSPFVVGINGAQGIGKSTLAELFALILITQYDTVTIQLSIDDFYKTHRERQAMAKQIHPLFATRGVPGTHDIQMGIDLFEAIEDNEATIKIPRFSKATDDRYPVSEWEAFEQTPEIVLFEGWCVGSLPQSQQDLIEPINALEKSEDPKGLWREKINHALKHEYQKLFSLIDFLVFLKAPDYECIFSWRLEQEHKLIKKVETNKGNLTHTMNPQSLKRFMMHFERLTRHNLEDIPGRADVVLEFDENRLVSRLNFNPNSQR